MRIGFMLFDAATYSLPLYPNSYPRGPFMTIGIAGLYHPIFTDRAITIRAAGPTAGDRSRDQLTEPIWRGTENPPGRDTGRAQSCARYGGRPAGRSLRSRLLDRHSHRQRSRPRRRPGVGTLLHLAAERPRLQQQCGAHLPTLLGRRHRLQARLHDGERQPAAGAALRPVAHRNEGRTSPSGFARSCTSSRTAARSPRN